VWGPLELEEFMRPMFQDMINKFSEFESNFRVDYESEELSRRTGSRLILQKCWGEMWFDVERMCLSTRTHKVLLPAQLVRLLETQRLVSDLFEEYGYRVRAQERECHSVRVLSLLELLSGPSSVMVSVWEEQLTEEACALEADRVAHRPHISRQALRKALKARKRYLGDEEASAFIRRHPSRGLGSRLKAVLGHAWRTRT
jgi:hypothetical protein